jgi:hypothetical protein
MEVDLDDDASVEAAATVLIPELFPGVELESSTIPVEEEDDDELLDDGLSPDEMTEEPIDDVLFPPIESESGSESGEGEEVLN